MKGKEAELYARVFADLDDDEPRLVLADFLQAQGDPHGELIALQVARARGKKGTVGREEKLMSAKNRAVWIGPVGAVLPVVRFERGFPYAVVVGAVEAKQVKIVEASLDQKNGFWSTVRQAQFRKSALIQTILTSAATQSLRVAKSVCDEDLLAICDASRGLDLEHLEGSVPTNPESIQKLGASPSLPRLRYLRLAGSSVLGIKPIDYRKLWSSPLAKRLDTFAVNAEIASLGAWLTEAAQNEGPSFELNADTDAHGWRVTLSRGADQKLSSLRAEYGHNANPKHMTGRLTELCRALAGVPVQLLTQVSVLAVGGAKLTIDATVIADLDKVIRSQKRLTTVEIPRSKCANPATAKLDREARAIGGRR